VLSADNPFYRRVTLLVELLPLVAREPCFALKGGTAINLFVRDLPRLSVDIDLTYLPIKGRDESLAHIDAALRSLGSAIEAALPGAKTLNLAPAGERLTKIRIQRAREQVQIEVSPVLRGSVREPEARESTPAVTAQFGLIRIPVLHPLELYAGKFCAALDRQHPRDLFDVMQFQQAGAIDRALFDVFLVYLLSGDRPIAEMLSPRFAPLAQVFTSEFGGMTLVPVTLEDLEEARRTLAVELRAMLTDADKEFLLSVKRGNGNWKSFAHPAAESLPAIQWKLQNIARMTPQKRAAAVGRLEAVLYKRGV
jgi:nucleotidyltransferase AbiEii toxin of type IV toxin-antitoxin system